MTSIQCEDAIERLPWFLNGTLTHEERVSLLSHLESCEPCRLALSETRTAWQIFSQHIPPEQLLAWAGGEASGGEDEVRARHLETCAQCAADLELVRMSRRLVEADGIALLPTQRSAARGDLWWRRSAMAAGLAAVVMGGGWLVTAARVGQLSTQLTRQPLASGAAQSNLAVVTLSAGGAERGAASEAAPLRPDCSGWTLILSPPPSDAAPPDTVSAKLLDARGQAVLDWGGEVRWLPRQGYTLELKRGLFQGPHTIHFYRQEAGKWMPYSEYPVILP